MMVAAFKLGKQNRRFEEESVKLRRAGRDL